MARSGSSDPADQARHIRDAAKAVLRLLFTIHSDAAAPSATTPTGTLVSRPRKLAPARQEAIAALTVQAAALRFHATRTSGDTPVVALVGGTGTGKSTLINRLVGTQVSQSSFRRTFTAGPVLACSNPDAIPDGWGGFDQPPLIAEQLPVQGEGARLTVAVVPQLDGFTLDTPDLDGDRPAHHALADRCFRWADAAVLVVTPEKYQMPELQPYIELARRWSLPTAVLMNKADDAATVDDWRRQLGDDLWTIVVPRDDSTYRPDEDGVGKLREFAHTARPNTDGLPRRASDFAGRLVDGVIRPLRHDRQHALSAAVAVRKLAATTPGLDVHPVTRQLQRRLREKSVLYLMGPGKIIDRVRSVPGVLARLPRTAIDFFRGVDAKPDDDGPTTGQVPDFPRLLREQFLTLQARLSDVLADAELPGSTASWKRDPDDAANIAEEEVAALRQWLEDRWNATPRDTAVLQKLLKVIPGGENLTKLSEAAPYLLTGYLAMSGALFGHLDLIALGGYGAATELLARLSDEVAAQTKKSNKKIAQRYEQLADGQIEDAAKWAERQAVDEGTLTELEKLADQLHG
ncbi:MAG: GTPase domain-containing protein [Planctomycetota bacterium]